MKTSLLVFAIAISAATGCAHVARAPQATQTSGGVPLGSWREAAPSSERKCAREIEFFADGTAESNDVLGDACSFARVPYVVEPGAPGRITLGKTPVLSCLYDVEAGHLRLACNKGSEAPANMSSAARLAPMEVHLQGGIGAVAGNWHNPARGETWGISADGFMQLPSGPARVQVGDFGRIVIDEAARRNRHLCRYRATERRLTIKCMRREGWPEFADAGAPPLVLTRVDP